MDWAAILMNFKLIESYEIHVAATYIPHNKLMCIILNYIITMPNKVLTAIVLVPDVASIIKSPSSYQHKMCFINNKIGFWFLFKTLLPTLILHVESRLFSNGLVEYLKSRIIKIIKYTTFWILNWIFPIGVPLIWRIYLLKS